MAVMMLCKQAWWILWSAVLWTPRSPTQQCLWVIHVPLHLSWIAYVTLDKSWTPSKPQMGENSRVPAAAVQSWCQSRASPRVVPRDPCIWRVPAVDPCCNKDLQMQWKKTVKPNKLHSRRKYIAGLSPLLFFLCWSWEEVAERKYLLLNRVQLLFAFLGNLFGFSLLVLVYAVMFPADCMGIVPTLGILCKDKKERRMVLSNEVAI